LAGTIGVWFAKATIADQLDCYRSLMAA